MNGRDRKDVGLLVLRIGIGGIFILHGYLKLSGGPAAWNGIGQVMGIFGITWAPKFWGFMAAISEFGGGICLALGLFFQIACVFITLTMLVALSLHISQGAPYATVSHPLKILVVMGSLLITGAGRYSLADMLKGPRKSG